MDSPSHSVLVPKTSLQYLKEQIEDERALMQMVREAGTTEDRESLLWQVQLKRARICGALSQMLVDAGYGAGS